MRRWMKRWTRRGGPDELRAAIAALGFRQRHLAAAAVAFGRAARAARDGRHVLELAPIGLIEAWHAWARNRKEPE